MSDDRRLLWMAAKAAGQERSHAGDLWSNARGMLWDPLTDDGDALRLAVKLGIHQTNSLTDAWATTLKVTAIESLGADPFAATRRAIVKAAALIGEAMP